ncbi:N-acetylmuramoyl-L-alanine amidase [Blastochloris sulfoviridis]|uniref:N-acetylmuramoyl-L-alanine amidase n=1 Tax=Blastochloris sulfoviridis TaxID=50712 RepID=UPI001FE7CE69|nr:N-acetylmuramoyl-L-alanine amidase [Blastochloris sulfoviridis]
MAQHAAVAATAPAGSGKDKGVTAVDVRLAGDLVRTRLVLDLTATVEMRVFTLADPYRVVVDVAGLDFNLPATAGHHGRGLITAFRYGQVGPGKARLVLEVREPVSVDKSFVLDAIDEQPARLVIDLVPTDRTSFLRSAEVPSSRVDPMAAIRNATAEPGTAAESKPPEAKLSETKPPKADSPARSRLPVVVIDPGHGGIDTGANAPGGGVSEKTVVLEVALMLRDRLEKGGRVNVVMTRTEDVFVPLGERVRIARRNEAALFLSIHADSIRARDGIASGASVYTLSEKASDAEAERLAESENKADLIAGVNLQEEAEDVADILIDLVQRETKSFSAHFAHTLVGEIRPTARMHRTPLKSAGFKVLKAPDVPSVLLELGFMSNRQELRQITSVAWRTKVTEAIADAIERFVAMRTAGGRTPK